MKKTLLFFMLTLLLLIGAACGNETSSNSEGTNSEDNSEASAEDKTITFGMTGWTSTEAPTNIAKLILEEAGYDVKFTVMDQPLIFKGLKEKEIDFFMDAWLPYTEATLWSKYEDSLQKVATSYENVPLGWVVPEYVEENTIAELKGNAEKYENRVVTIAPGAGIVTLSEDVISEYGLDKFKLMTSSESAMMAEVETHIKNKEPIVFTGWRPHSMFSKYDLKFLEDEKEIFKADNVYVLSYKGFEEDHPEVYDIMSKWSIEVEDLEEMMLQYEENDIPFEESAKAWIEENRSKVDAMLE